MCPEVVLLFLAFGYKGRGKPLDSTARASMVGGGKKDDDSEPLKLTCCRRRSLVLLGQGGNWLKVNTGRNQRGWV